MHFLKFLAGSVALACAFGATASFTRSVALADDMGMTTCPAFTSTKWVSPMPGPKPSGDGYTVTISGNAMSCADAVSWAKKLIPQHIDGKPMMPDYPPLKGGPAGYVCKGSPDTTGHAWRGSCQKNDVMATGFTWTDN